MIRGSIYINMLFVITTSLNGQTVSSLHQILSSNALINRPMVFRDMQASMGKLVGKVKPGVELDLFYNKMSEVRTNLLIMIEAPKVQTNGDATLKFEFKRGEQFTINLKFKGVKKTPNQILKEFEQELTVIFYDIIDKIPITPEERKDAILAALLMTINESGITRGISRKNVPDDYSSKLAKMIAAILVEKLKVEVQIRFSVNLYEKYTNMDTIKNYIQQGIDKATEKVREAVAKALDKAEYEISNVIDEFSKYLLSGNAGLAVTKGEGNFGGGIQLSCVHGSSFQTGLYVNGQFSESDTTHSLIGIVLKYATNTWQGDLLVSGLFNDKRFENFNAGEAGVGISFRISKDIILGPAYFILFSDKSPTHLIGATFKGTSPDSPAVLLGAEMHKDAVHPIFQISFPIVLAK